MRRVIAVAVFVGAGMVLLADEPKSPDGSTAARGITVSVEDAAGRPAAGTITIVPASGSGAIDEGPLEEGKFSRAGASGDQVLLFASSPPESSKAATTPWECDVLPPDDGKGSPSSFWGGRCPVGAADPGSMTLARVGRVRVVGTVTHVDGTPEPKCLVALFQPRADRKISRMEGAYTNEKGEFSFEGLLPCGPCQTVVRPRKPSKLKLTSGPRQPLNLPDRTGVHLDFVVGDEMPAETRPFVTPLSVPLETAELVVSNAGDRWTAVNLGKGQYTFKGIPTGIHDITIVFPASAELLEKCGSSLKGPIRMLYSNCAFDKPINGMPFIVSRCETEEDLFDIEGRVSLKSGPWPGVEVPVVVAEGPEDALLMETGATSIVTQSGAKEGRVLPIPVSRRTDKEGRFVLKKMPRGPYGILVQHPTDPTRGVLLSFSGPRKGESTDTKEGVFRDTPGETGSISGVVVNRRGHPILSNTVENQMVIAAIGGDGNFWTTMTQEGGKFTFPALPPGRYQVSAMVAGVTDRTDWVTVEVDKRVEVHVKASGLEMACPGE